MVITISRQLASLGNKIAESLYRKTGLPLINRAGMLSQFMPEASALELHMLGESA